ncbi:MAG: FHA domain-containing protein [Pyrinomonadaceae bacterium]
MPKAKIIIVEAGKEPRELEILGDVTTFGRTKDNSVSFAGDGNISRFHAQIKRHGEDFFVSDFGSSNGTSVNDQKISEEKLLKHNDKINFGGDNSYVIFKNEELSSEEQENEAEGFSSADVGSSQNSAANSTSGSPPPKSNVPIMLSAAAVLSGLAIVAVVAVVIVTQTNLVSGSCAPEVAILSPESGTTISEPTEIKVSVKNAKCIERVAYLLDGEEIETAEIEPYSVTLEPEKFESFKDDSSHVLTIAVYDRDGAKKLQNDQLNLAFGEADSEVPPDKPIGDNPPDDKPTPPKPSQITIAETKVLTEQFLKQFPGAYRLNTQFLIEVQKKTAEYKAPGFYLRAAPYRDVINQAFVQEQGLYAPLGYILAMSLSKFDNKKNGNSEGLWQMTNEFTASNGYNGQCGIETLSDASQNCAAHAAAIYTKAMVVNLFQGDVVYGVSCFGLSPFDAGQFQISLPPDRSDFWNVIKSPKQREMVVRFFAAGIVAENPQKFGLKQDKPLSSLYKNLLILK